MKVKINGKAEDVKGAPNIAELLTAKGLSCERVVVEHNKRIVPKESLHVQALRDDDTLEIVAFVGGG